MLSFKAIPEILSDNDCSEKTKEHYIEMSKKGLRNGDNIFNHLCFIKALCVNAGGYSEVKRFVKDYNITDIILAAADSYTKRKGSSH